MDPKQVIAGFKDDLKDFKALLPLEELRKLIQKYLLDPELGDLGRYAQSQNVLPIFEGLIQLPSVQNMFKFLKDEGAVADGNAVANRFCLKIMKMINKFSNGIKGRGVSNLVKETVGIQNFLDELSQLIPVSNITQMRQHKFMMSESYNTVSNLMSMISQQEVEHYFQVITKDNLISNN